MLNRSMAVALSGAYILLAAALLVLYTLTFFLGPKSLENLITIQATVAKTWPLFFLISFISGVLIYLFGVVANKNNDFNRLQLGPAFARSAIIVTVFAILFVLVNSLLFGDFVYWHFRSASGHFEIYQFQKWVVLNLPDANQAVMGLLRYQLASALFACTLAFGMALMGFVEASTNKRLSAAEEKNSVK